MVLRSGRAPSSGIPDDPRGLLSLGSSRAFGLDPLTPPGSFLSDHPRFLRTPGPRLLSPQGPADIVRNQ
ncbi:hypothetical protein NDU88_000266 [Pleurodeles waltl]|uniref:Uncharacterized protein n=1 Tax=Pleurodeles waltl TaxID=8319 RepID=A0AAV7KQ76_PLEWA|nr:hypothetical protein NDU88_000266 [Pleurodeles waltl]